MQGQSARRSVDLTAYPGLVVVYLGIRVTRWRGFLTILGLGRGIGQAVAGKPDGLLAHEAVFYGLTHIGMRQYWRDLDALGRFTKSEPHKSWWRDFSRGNSGTGFWHETYTRGGGMEAIYIDMPAPIGFGLFAEPRAPVGPFLSSRERLAAAAPTS